MTVIPVILASDKTNLTALRGGKQAYPVYIMIGNIPSELRRKESYGGTQVSAYLPVTKIPGYSKLERQALLRELFHQSMARVLEPLRSAGQEGVEMEDADGKVRHTHPIYAIHLADYQEQVLIGCCKGCRCPMCRAALKSLGILKTYEPQWTLETAEAIKAGTDFDLNSVSSPYWERLPLVRLHTLFPPDALHQLLKGMFKNHVFSWCRGATGNDNEIDRRFKVLPPFPTLKHFRNGVTRISQWTGNEFRAMVRVFLGVIVHAPNISPVAVAAVRALLDFLFICHFDFHDNTSLRDLENSLRTFHELKDEFIKIGGRSEKAIVPDD